MRLRALWVERDVDENMFGVLFGMGCVRTLPRMKRDSAKTAWQGYPKFSNAV